MAEVKLKEETELWDPPNTKHSLEPPHIKEEPEEEQLQEFSFTPVSVKTEDDEDKSSVLHQRPTEENREETNGEECGAEAGCSSDPQLHSDSEGHPLQIARVRRGDVCEEAYHLLDASFSEQGEAEDQDLSESRPDTPSAASTSTAASSLESLSEGASPTAVEETSSTASTGSSTKGEKRKRLAEFDIELQKLKVLQKMASKVDAQPTPDALTAFGNHVVSEMRQIQDPGYLARLKKSIMIMIYDTQENERNRSFSSHAPPTPFQPIISAPPPARSHPHYTSAQGPHPNVLQTLQDHDHYESL